VPESPDVEFTSVWTTKSRQNPPSYVSQSVGSGSIGSFSSNASNDKVLIAKCSFNDQYGSMTWLSSIDFILSMSQLWMKIGWGQAPLMSCVTFSALTMLVGNTKPRVGTYQSPPSFLIPSFPHLLLCLLLSFLFTFPFLTCSVFFSCFSILSHSTRIIPLRFQAGCRRRRLNLALVFCVDFMLSVFLS